MLCLIKVKLPDMYIIVKKREIKFPSLANSFKNGNPRNINGNVLPVLSTHKGDRGFLL